MLTGKRIFVTGAANGCGAGAARVFVEHGATVFATDVADGDALRAELEPSGRLTFRRLDVSDRDAVHASVDEAAGALGGLDALVHAAGIVHNAPAIDATTAEWDRVFDVNVKGTLHANQAVFPHLRAAGGGAIVNFASIAGIRGMRGFSIYGAAKGAVLAWTRNVALEWGAHGIRVNAVVPAMASRMTEQAQAACTLEQLEQLQASTAAATAIRGTLGEPTRDLAPLLALLVGDGGSYITGQAIAVDGGMMMLGS